MRIFALTNHKQNIDAQEKEWVKSKNCRTRRTAKTLLLRSVGKLIFHIAKFLILKILEKYSNNVLAISKYFSSKFMLRVHLNDRLVNCRIIFSLRRMIEIMHKARIKYSSLKIVDGICVEPMQETQSFFDRLISDFQTNSPSDNSGCPNAQKTVLLCNRNDILDVFYAPF